MVLFRPLQARSAVGWAEKDHFNHVQLHELLAVNGAMVVIKLVCVCVCVCGVVMLLCVCVRAQSFQGF